MFYFDLLYLFGALFLSYRLFVLTKSIKKKDAIIKDLSKDYVKYNREAKKFKNKYDNLLQFHAKEVGIKK